MESTVTITDVIQYLVRQQGQAIYEMKQAARSVKVTEAEVYVSPDGKTKRQSHSGVPGWTKKIERTEKVVAFINPKLGEKWAEYQRARQRASHLLTARALLKVGDGELPASAVLRKAVGDGTLTHHLRHGQSRYGAATAALRTLRKLSNRLQNHPERFASVAVWAAERDARVG